MQNCEIQINEVKDLITLIGDRTEIAKKLEISVRALNYWIKKNYIPTQYQTFFEKELEKVNEEQEEINITELFKHNQCGRKLGSKNKQKPEPILLTVPVISNWYTRTLNNKIVECKQHNVQTELELNLDLDSNTITSNKKERICVTKLLSEKTTTENQDAIVELQTRNSKTQIHEIIASYIRKYKEDSESLSYLGMCGPNWGELNTWKNYTFSQKFKQIVSIESNKLCAVTAHNCKNKIQTKNNFKNANIQVIEGTDSELFMGSVHHYNLQSKTQVNKGLDIVWLDRMCTLNADSSGHIKAISSSFPLPQDKVSLFGITLLAGHTRACAAPANRESSEIYIKYAKLGYPSDYSDVNQYEKLKDQAEPHKIRLQGLAHLIHLNLQDNQQQFHPLYACAYQEEKENENLGSPMIFLFGLIYHNDKAQNFSNNPLNEKNNLNFPTVNYSQNLINKLELV